ncbi:hypothetical protein BAUCODRAFT_127254 [Baudoinia panamericana UAMH 10762]|uniref:Uncharacterized protein n=1 Tax=Baudoinia panamericana (strain UAMH 10762) TaxID=717646 RepID=M2MJ92_BAUPA|nr:uncharacterized protein BAUCODRAFT_127254 [Baudoinia panamericana UAMH 10762]EMC91348.1 hypothetical protein BAUCODRAFT_127254 [Baudoinia panamericana UAMH 10762]
MAVAFERCRTFRASSGTSNRLCKHFGQLRRVKRRTAREVACYDRAVVVGDSDARRDAGNDIVQRTVRTTSLVATAATVSIITPEVHTTAGRISTEPRLVMKSGTLSSIARVSRKPCLPVSHTVTIAAKFRITASVFTESIQARTQAHSQPESESRTEPGMQTDQLTARSDCCLPNTKRALSSAYIGSWKPHVADLGATAGLQSQPDNQASCLAVTDLGNG